MEYRWNKNWAAKHIAGVTDKKILVVNDIQLARKLAVSNSVTYLTDDEKSYHTFLKMVSPLNNVNFGMDDSVHLVDYKGDYTKEITGMKFDLIVGNPPYEGKGKPLYLQILAHLMPYAKEVVWICPTQWTKAWKDIPYTAELKKSTLNCLIDHECMPSPFEDAAICQGVAVYHFGEADKYESYEDLRYEKFSNVELAKSIISKLEAHESLTEHVRNRNGNYYVNFESQRGHHECGIPKWDWLTLMPEEWKSDFNQKKDTKGTDRIYFKFDTEEEARNFIGSTETDIAMFALSICKSNRHIIQSTISYIPWLGDYTRSWNDDQIAAELGLTKEEVDYIHEEMKNFGWKCAKKAKK